MGAVAEFAATSSRLASFARSLLSASSGQLGLTRCRTLNFSDEERAAVTGLVRRTLDEDEFPFSDRRRPLTSALAKLDPAKAAARRENPCGRAYVSLAGTLFPPGMLIPQQGADW